MSAYDRLPPIKPPRSMAWYTQVAGEPDDALKEGLALLETLRGALPPDKSHAVDEAARLLREAAELYAHSGLAGTQVDPKSLADLLPPEKRQLLLELTAVLHRARERR